MADTYWSKQSDEPLYPDITWSRPEAKSASGKLTIIGGNAHGFSSPGHAYATAFSAGIGVCHVVLPDGIRKIVKGILPDAEYAPSTPSGSFGMKALDTLVSTANWGDAVLLAGDLGRNSETAIVLEHFIQKYTGKLIITHDAVDYFKETAVQIVDREDTLIVLSMAQLQKIFINTPTITPIVYSMSTQQLVSALHDYSQPHQACIVTRHNNLIFIAKDGKVTTTKDAREHWRVETAAKASVYWLQNPDEILKATTVSLLNN